MEEPSTQNWRRFTRLRPDKKRLKRRAKKIETATLKHAHTFIVRRWNNVKNVRRFALSWAILVTLLIAVSGLQMLVYHQAFSAVVRSDGGTFAEGVTGPLETMNPLFATSSAERSATRLIFSGLLSYDRENKLRGNIASSWKIEDGGRRYVVTLKQDATWHDGVPVTADDVVFTVERMKNPLTRSAVALRDSWAGVDVKKLSQHQVAFELPIAYAPFPHALTFGLIPKHLLNDIPPESLREAAFNRAPVGTGPFKFNRLQIINPEEDRMVLYLNANDKYMLGTPKLERFQLHVYQSSEKIKNAFITKEINAATDLSSEHLREVREANPQAVIPTVKVFDGVYALFNTKSPILKDRVVRQALRLATDRSQLLENINNQGELLEGPLLPEHYPSFATKKQPSFNAQAAASALDKAGWKLRDGVRYKGDTELKLTVVAPRIGDYPAIMETIASQWRSIGINLQIQLVDPENIQQNVLLPRTYDILIYELVLGADPDVSFYWHSSQANPRGLNLSNYESDIADEALQSAQARPERALREPKYHTFIDQWLSDVPAVALYKPYLHYAQSDSVSTMRSDTTLTDAQGRYRNIHLWTVSQSLMYRTP